VHPHERKVEQDLFFDLEMDYSFAAAADSDLLENALDYTDLSESFDAWVREQRFQLVETLAMRAADWLLVKDERIAACAVVVRKPAALTWARHAEVRVERSRT
jgi:dihydroneopterin aldolase